MTTPAETQNRFNTNPTGLPNADTIAVNTIARAKTKLSTAKDAKMREARRSIEWHMEQRQLKQELADFGFSDETLS
jgi:hypothetical protein